MVDRVLVDQNLVAVIRPQTRGMLIAIAETKRISFAPW